MITITEKNNSEQLLTYYSSILDISSQKIIDFFIQKLQENHKNDMQEFIEMQNVADIPLIEDDKSEIEIEYLLKQAVHQEMILASLKNEISQHQRMLEQANQESMQLKKQALESKENYSRDEKNLKEQLQNFKKDNNLIANQLYHAQKELEEYYLSNQQNEKALKIANQEMQSITKVIEEYKKQTEQVKLVINQLHQAQEELEKLYLENQLLKSNNDHNNNLQEENDLLIAQLHQIQGELEKYYLENQHLKANQPINNNPLYGAADRIKQDLPYRLGSLMIHSSKSFKSLIILPFSLRKEYLNFKNSQKELPPIEAYKDVHEIEKVKKHLSYKLGNTLIHGIKTKKSKGS